ncbi:MAG: efflux RND transporter periplasmic adaptor subunit [bacterium]|nr:efflux RND transporter periplasmic adaptor subunit [bacterium]
MNRIHQHRTGVRLGFVILTMLALLVAAGCGRRKVPEAVEAESNIVTPVVTHIVAPVTFDLKVDLTGSTEAAREVDISAKVGGTVDHFPQLVGDVVAAGDLILRIDPRLHQAGADRARAGVLAAEAVHEHAGRELERGRQLKARERISDAEFEGIELASKQAASGLLSARAALAMAELQLEDCEIRAPFAGRITSREVEVGEQVGPGQPLTGVIDLGSIIIRSSLSERDAVQVREGMEVNVNIPALQEETFRGRVRSVGVRSDAATRSYSIEVEVVNPGGRILSGMAARGEIRLSSQAGVITTPVAAIVDQYGQAFVYVVKENMALRRKVKLGPRSGDDYIVESGLEAGDNLIVKGQFSVRDSMQVDIKNPSDLD